MDFTRPGLTRALQEVIAGFRVYRTYISEGHLLERDRQYVESAVAHAKRRHPDMNLSIFDFVRDMLLLRYRENADETEREAQRRFVGKFQQLTGPIMAKAIEDSAFYRYNRLVSLNEVGGDPKRFGVSVAEFHAHNERQRARSSRNLLASSTHDTKRSEDVRARIHVLSEVPGPWRKAIYRWRRWNKRLKIDVEGEEAPSRNDEYLLYQTLIGVWPGLPLEAAARGHLIERLQEYLLKAAREAKVHTSWVNLHEPYEAALRHFVAGLFDPAHRPFVEDLDRFARSVSDHGMWNSLAALVLKIASPGVADFFQGMELWTYTLVDPDNRRPVDFALRRKLLEEVKGRWATACTAEGNGDVASPQAFISELLSSRADGRIKLFATWRGLELRRQHQQVFVQGDYVPLEAQGSLAPHVVALARRYQGEMILAVVPRLTVGVTGFGGPPPMGDAWQDTSLQLPSPLAGSVLHNVLTDERLEIAPGERGLPLATALRHLPVGLFVLCPGGVSPGAQEDDRRPARPR
jgi:(1->4)-alpha-D-glucan 1-alpha-D-glucosylmutase